MSMVRMKAVKCTLSVRHLQHIGRFRRPVSGFQILFVDLKDSACIDSSFDWNHRFIKRNVAEPTVDIERENDGASLD
jgi:hypothetical protein